MGSVGVDDAAASGVVVLPCRTPYHRSRFISVKKGHGTVRFSAHIVLTCIDILLVFGTTLMRELTLCT